ncbi:MAG: 4Fe-4S binding protein [Candidatus Brocadiia bacterium]
MPKITVREERCKGCGLCISICPKQVLAPSESINSKGYHPTFMKYPEKCIGCTMCALTCPDQVIEVYR